MKQSKVSSPRALALAVGGLVFGLVLLLLLVFLFIPRLTESGTIKVSPGSATLPLGNARVKADSIAQDGPFLFSDPASGQHDIFVQHTGDDPLKGWIAFDARQPGTSRDCTLVWDNTRKLFTDPCDHATVAADGDGLPTYPVTVDGDEQLSLDLRSTGTTTIPGATGTTAAG